MSDDEHTTPDSVVHLALVQLAQAVVVIWALGGPFEATGQSHDLPNSGSSSRPTRPAGRCCAAAERPGPMIFGWTPGCVIGADRLPTMGQMASGLVECRRGEFGT